MNAVTESPATTEWTFTENLADELADLLEDLYNQTPAERARQFRVRVMDWHRRLETITRALAAAPVRMRAFTSESAGAKASDNVWSPAESLAEQVALLSDFISNPRWPGEEKAREFALRITDWYGRLEVIEASLRADRSDSAA